MMTEVAALAPLSVVVRQTFDLRVLACASQGSGGDDEARLRVLLSGFDTTFVPFTRDKKLQSFLACLQALRLRDYDVFVLEGTGVGAGLPAVLGALLFRRPFVLSSGDAVGPFLSARFPLASPIFHLYERLLYRCSAGFIGWTPYLVGRALTLGARSAITCPGWAPYSVDRNHLARARSRVRKELGIREDAIVFGIAGALTWSERYGYCYGLELIRALHLSTSNVCVLIVGDGDGLVHLKRAAGEALGRTIFLPGRVARNEVPDYLAAMDVGSLPQSVDAVGGFRYTTKIAEYRSIGMPFVTNLNPVAYDLDRGDIWRVPGKSPWDKTFLQALSRFMMAVTLEDLDRVFLEPVHDQEFDRDEQVRRVTAFLRDIAGIPTQVARFAGARS